ncbi:hypothetical protein ACQEU8_31520 [Streptomyces sp. CA-250714]|uniref:hypothetical protein n=1 Tax=Streptomyces sp. CA-250714 TaxID=3240060 RepID=UPI003D918C44
MVLSTDERDLLQMIADSPQPVAMSDYFPVLNPAEPGMDENHPGHEAWTERHIAWNGVSVALWDDGEDEPEIWHVAGDMYDWEGARSVEHVGGFEVLPRRPL